MEEYDFHRAAVARLVLRYCFLGILIAAIVSSVGRISFPLSALCISSAAVCAGMIHHLAAML